MADDALQLIDGLGFDKVHWPSMADTTWATDVHAFYGVSRTYDSPTTRTM